MEFSRRAAENQSLFREVNEKIADFNEAFTAMTPYGNWSCECASTDCLERIQMTLGEYEQLRTTPTRFAVAPDEQHVFPEVERVVARHDRYWVVEKTGIAAKTSVERDPRGRAER